MGTLWRQVFCRRAMIRCVMRATPIIGIDQAYGGWNAAVGDCQVISLES
jgi:hypothetical protein